MSESQVDDDDHHIVIPAEAPGFVAVVTAVLTAGLLLLTPLATRPAPMQKGWWVEPMTWPLVCLSLTLVAALIQAVPWFLRYKISDRKAEYLTSSVWAFRAMRPAFEYAFYFCVYLFALGYVGFAISTLLFMQFMVWRSGLKGWQWQLKSAIFVVITVIAFRVVMQLWFPMPPILTHLPDWFVQNIAIYL